MAKKQIRLKLNEHQKIELFTYSAVIILSWLMVAALQIQNYAVNDIWHARYLAIGFTIISLLFLGECTKEIMKENKPIAP